MTIFEKQCNTCAKILHLLDFHKSFVSKDGRQNKCKSSAKLNATPDWLTQKDINEIKEFYELAQELSWLSESPLEVDHIIPLQGKNVSGLHVPWNLQILPKSMNLSKGNK